MTQNHPQIKDMINSGELINVDDKVTLQIFDAKIAKKDIAVFQTIGYSKDFDTYFTMNYCANMTTARKFGQYLLELANKYDPQTVEIKEIKTKKENK